MPASEHLLLATLGESPGALLSLFDWLNRRGDWAHADPAPDVPPFTHLWVVTTKSDQIDARRDLLAPLDADPAFHGVRRRVLQVDLKDISNDADHQLMSEVVHRLVLQGEAWRRGGPGRLFSVSLAGGRKTMSAVLQQAAQLFAVDNVFHVALAAPADPKTPREDTMPRTLAKVREHRARHFPLRLSKTQSAWRPWLDQLWRRVHADVPLHPDGFPLSDGWSEASASHAEPVPVAVPADRSGGLVLRLEAAAGEGDRFARQALAAGVGGSFLRHDLADLVKGLHLRLPDQPELAALEQYVQGLRCVVADVADPTAPGASMEELPVLCESALVLAAGRVVPAEPGGGPCAWRLPGVLALRLEGLEAVRPLRCRVAADLLLLGLRNLLSNVRRHGVSGDWPEPTATLQVEETGGRLRLTASNPVPRRSRDLLRGLADEHGRLTDLLHPFRPAGPTGGDGLGLYTVHHIIELAGDGASLDGPRLRPGRQPGPARSTSS